MLLTSSRRRPRARAPRARSPSTRRASSLSWSRSAILRLGVLVLGAPEQRVERAHLDADAAVHAQRVVDVEAVEVVHLARLAAGTAGRGELLVALDVDAPVGARAGAQHAGGAVVLAEGDDAAGTDRRRFLLVRVLHGVGAVGDRCRSSVPSVTPRPLNRPGTFGFGRPSERHLQDGGDHDVERAPAG